MKICFVKNLRDYKLFRLPRVIMVSILKKISRHKRISLNFQPNLFSPPHLRRRNWGATLSISTESNEWKNIVKRDLVQFYNWNNFFSISFLYFLMASWGEEDSRAFYISKWFSNFLITFNLWRRGGRKSQFYNNAKVKTYLAKRFVLMPRITTYKEIIF